VPESQEVSIHAAGTVSEEGGQEKEMKFDAQAPELSGLCPPTFEYAHPGFHDLVGNDYSLSTRITKAGVSKLISIILY